MFLFFQLVLLFFTSSFLEGNNPAFQEECEKIKNLVKESKFEEAQACLPRLDSLAQLDNSLKMKADHLFQKGYFWMFKVGDIQSFKLLTEASKIYQQLGLKEEENLVEANLCISLYYLTRYDECLQKAEKLLEIVPHHEEETRGILQNIIGAIYGGGNGIPEKAIYHCQQAIPYFKKVNDYRRLISLYGIITASYNNTKNYQTALVYLDSATHYAHQANNNNEVAFLDIRRARTLFNMKQVKSAISTLKKVEKYYLKNGSKHGQLSWVYGLLKKYNAEIGEYKNVYTYTLLSDSLSRIERLMENDKALNDLMVKYETEKKEQQIKMQLLVIDHEKQRYQQLIFKTIAVLGFLVLFFAMAYFYYRNQQEEQLRTAQIKYQEQLLETTINTQEEERKRIARDLHDGIGQQMSGLKMGFHFLSQKMPNTSSEQQTQMIRLNQILEEATIDIRELSHQMMPKALRDLGLIPALNDMLDKSFNNTNVNCEFEDFGRKERLPENMAIGVYRIVQELINNILKHAEASIVTVQVFQKVNLLRVIVEDNGKGFDINSKFHEGHGMLNINSRVSALKGKLHFETAPNQGTTVSITFPLSSDINLI